MGIVVVDTVASAKALADGFVAFFHDLDAVLDLRLHDLLKLVQQPGRRAAAAAAM